MNTELKIEVMARTVYGVEAYYPVCPLASGFARIAGTKTLTEATLRTIHGMGYRIDVIRPAAPSFASVAA
jgi:hypothetical protein